MSKTIILLALTAALISGAGLNGPKDIADNNVKDVFTNKNEYLLTEKGMDASDAEVLKTAEEFLNSVILGEKEPFENDDINTETIKLISADLNNLKKVYPILETGIKNMDDETAAGGIIYNKDVYFLDIPCVTEGKNISLLSLNAGGDSANTLLYNASAMDNEDIIKSIMPLLKNNETVERIKYMSSTAVCPFEAAVIITSANSEFFIPYTDSGKYHGLIKGRVYSKNKFMDIISGYFVSNH